MTKKKVLYKILTLGTRELFAKLVCHRLWPLLAEQSPRTCSKTELQVWLQIDPHRSAKYQPRCKEEKMRYNTRIQRKRPLKEKTWKVNGFKKTDGCHLPTPPPIPAPLPAYLIHHGTSLCGPPPSPPPPGAMLEKKFCIASKTHRICNAQTRFPRISFFFLRDDTLDSHAENQRFQSIFKNTSAVKFDGHLESPQKRAELFLSSMRNIQEHFWCTLKEKRLKITFP